MPVSADETARSPGERDPRPPHPTWNTAAERDHASARARPEEPGEGLQSRPGGGPDADPREPRSELAAQRAAERLWEELCGLGHLVERGQRWQAGHCYSTPGVCYRL